MYHQIVLRYPGGKWQTYGGIVAAAWLSHHMTSARLAHPNAHISTIQGSTVEAVADYRQRMLDKGDLESAEHMRGPSAVPPSELGEGGDHDEPYFGPVLPDQWPVTSAWVRLMSRFRRGDVGGEHDGQLRLPPAKEESA